jgi:hypothetical protein
MTFNNYERENVAEKVSDKMHAQARKGIWNGGLVPFGYTYDLRAKLLSPDPAEGAVVRRVFAKAAELVSLTQLAEELNLEGMRTRPRTFRTRHGTEREVGGKRFRSDWLRQVIQNPIYRGIIRYGGEEFPGRHEALVTPELWESANAAIRETIKPARCQRVGRDRHNNLLKGLAVCGDCDRALVPHATGKRNPAGNPYRYYRCDSVQKERQDSRCQVRQVSAVGLERCVTGLLSQLARHPDIVEAVLKTGRTKAGEMLAAVEKRFAALGREIAQTTSQLQHLVEALADGGIRAMGDELRAKMEMVKARKDTLLVERARLQGEREALQQEQLAPEKICTELKRFDAVWDRMTNDERRELVRLLVARVEVRVPAKESANQKLAERVLQLRIKLHLPELLAGSSSAARKKLFAVDAAVQLPTGNTGEIVITAPFQHTVAGTRKRPDAKARQVKRREHPLERALRWKKLLQSNPGMTARSLAKKEKVSEATMSMTLRLLDLEPGIQERILSIAGLPSAYHLGLRRLAGIAATSPGEQRTAIEALLQHWRDGRLASAEPHQKL